MEIKISGKGSYLKKILTIVISLAILVVITILYLGITPSTEQFKDGEGNVIPDSIATLEDVDLGKMKQWISIRGKDRSNPVLLWLHGGPGSAQMSLAHHLDERLEEEFIVVHWDQRGAGKSNHDGFDEKTMTFEQFKNDAHELIGYLQTHLKKEKIYLLGHSWGSQLGIELVNDYPEDFHAYIGVSQVVDNRRAVGLAYDWLTEEIEQNNDQASLKKLEEIGEQPYSHSQYREFAQLVVLYGGNFDTEMWRLALIAAGAPEYTFMDYYRLLNGMNRGGGPMHHQDGEMSQFNFIEEIPSVNVPTFFFIGENDYNTPLQLVEEYYNMIEAPQKDLIVFENSAHTPFLREKEKFNRKIIQIKDEIHQ